MRGSLASDRCCTWTAAATAGWRLVPEERQTLIQVIDDATSRLLYAQLWPAETTPGGDDGDA